MERVVLVTVSGPDPKLIKSGLTHNSSSKDGRTRLTSTGLIFNALPGFVITSLLPIHPFLQTQFRSHPSTVDGTDANSNPKIFLPGTRITCSYPGPNTTTTTQEVRVECIIELKDVRNALRSLLTAPSATRWSVAYSNLNLNNQVPLETQLNLGSHVVVLRQIPLASAASAEVIGNGSNHKKIGESQRLTHTEGKKKFFDSVNKNFSKLLLGTPIAAYGCPFGALVSLKFHNFMVSGAISAVLDNQATIDNQYQQRVGSAASSVLALSDLKSLPGMEGSAVYINNNKKHLLGMLGPPLRAPEANAELSLIISAAAVLTAVFKNFEKRQILPFFGNAAITPSVNFKTHAERVNQWVEEEEEKEEKEAIPSLFSEAIHAVVAVEAKNGWASGVIITSHGHILTNAHALPALTSSTTSLPPVRVLVDKEWVTAEVVHVFSPLIDLAVLKLIPMKFFSRSHSSGTSSSSTSLTRLPKPVQLGGTSLCRPGRSVAVVGYPLWRPSNKNNRPIVTVGSAALVVPALPAAPAVIVTTADVHAGASGGAVLDLETGCLLGLVTSNTRLGKASQQLSTPPRSFQQQQPSPAFNKFSRENDVYNNGSYSKQRAVLIPHLNYCLGSAALAPVIEMLATSEQKSAASVPLDWSLVENKLKESGVVEAWRSMRSMENLNDMPDGQIKQNLPPALAALMKNKIREHSNSSGGSFTARPKL